MTTLQHGERRRGVVRLRQFGMVLIVEHSTIFALHGVLGRSLRIGQVDSNRTIDDIQSGRTYVNTSDAIYERRHQRRELTRSRVGTDKEFAGILCSRSTPCETTYRIRTGIAQKHGIRIGSIGHGGLVLYAQHVETIAVAILRLQGQRSRTDIVRTQSETKRLATLYITTYYTSREVDQRVVGEGESGTGFIEVLTGTFPILIRRETTVVDEGVTLFLHLDIMFADRYADRELAIRIGGDQLAVERTDIPVHIEIATLHGIVRAFV